MKIGELNQHCGECRIIELCGEPYSDICLCANPNLESITEEEYIEYVDNIRKNQKKNWSNKTLEKMIIKEIKNNEN